MNELRTEQWWVWRKQTLMTLSVSPCELLHSTVAADIGLIHCFLWLVIKNSLFLYVQKIKISIKTETRTKGDVWWTEQIEFSVCKTEINNIFFSTSFFLTTRKSGNMLILWDYEIMIIWIIWEIIQITPETQSKRDKAASGSKWLFLSWLEKSWSKRLSVVTAAAAATNKSPFISHHSAPIKGVGMYVYSHSHTH